MPISPGLERLNERGGDLSTVSSVASFFVSRVDTAVDNLLDGLIAEGRDDLKPLLGRAAVANAHLAYLTFAREFGGPRFADLRRRGARAQRPLWASTSVKNPAYDDLLYVRSLMARDTVNTMPRATIDTLMERGIDAHHAIGDEAGEGRGTGAGRTQQRGNRHGRRHVPFFLGTASRRSPTPTTCSCATSRRRQTSSPSAPARTRDSRSP